MGWMSHRDFRPLIHGCSRDHHVLKSAHFLNDHDVHDDAGDDAADVADKCKKSINQGMGGRPSKVALRVD
jgi:hypothetical protein